MYNGRSSPEGSVDLRVSEIFYSGKIAGMNEDLLDQFWGQLSEWVHGGGHT
jgi:hypothetical protein